MASVDADNENDTESAPWKVFEITKLVLAQREESKLQRSTQKEKIINNKFQSRYDVTY